MNAIDEEEQAPTEQQETRNTSKFPAVTIAVINHNGLEALESCLAKIFEIDYPEFDVMMVDNASTDSSIEYVHTHYKVVNVHKLATNRGPNAARNFALLNAKHRYIFLLDNDAVLTKDCLANLVSKLMLYPKAATCSPLIVDLDSPGKVQYAATHIHFIGAAIFENSNIDRLQQQNGVSITTTINGTAVLIDRARANGIGIFDEEMFFGWTDGDYSFRITAAGYQCLIDHYSKVLHPESVRPKSLVKHQVKNRWVFILKNYSLRTILLASPALFFYECALFVFLTITGHLKEYLIGVTAIILLLPETMRKRREFFAVKKLSDANLLRNGDFLSLQFIVKNSLLRKCVLFFNVIVDKYWLVVKRFV